MHPPTGLHLRCAERCEESIDTRPGVNDELGHVPILPPHATVGLGPVGVKACDRRWVERQDALPERTLLARHVFNDPPRLDRTAVDAAVDLGELRLALRRRGRHHGLPGACQQVRENVESLLLGVHLLRTDLGLTTFSFGFRLGRHVLRGLVREVPLRATHNSDVKTPHPGDDVLPSEGLTRPEQGEDLHVYDTERLDELTTLIAERGILTRLPLLFLAEFGGFGFATSLFGTLLREFGFGLRLGLLRDLLIDPHPQVAQLGTIFDARHPTHEVFASAAVIRPDRGEDFHVRVTHERHELGALLAELRFGFGGLAGLGSLRLLALELRLAGLEHGEELYARSVELGGVDGRRGGDRDGRGLGRHRLDRLCLATEHGAVADGLRRGGRAGRLGRLGDDLLAAADRGNTGRELRLIETTAGGAARLTGVPPTSGGDVELVRVSAHCELQQSEEQGQ